MSSKAKAKAAPKSDKKSVKPISKKSETPQSAFLAHWLHDVSLESGGPVRAFSPGERQLDMLASAHHTTISQEGHVRLELRLRAHIHTEAASLAIAEIKYAAVVEKKQSENGIPPLLAELYPFARQAIEDVLALAGHKAPVPETLELAKTQS